MGRHGAQGGQLGQGEVWHYPATFINSSNIERIITSVGQGHIGGSLMEHSMTRTVLITGCSSGFGAATARLFADRGWNVVATMRRPEAADAGLAASDTILLTTLDVQDRASIDAAVAGAIARFGRIDVLVNNAGF